MIPGEILTMQGDIEINAGAMSLTLMVANTGDRPIQVGSHYTLPRPMRVCRLTAAPRVACGWISPPEPPCASSRAKAGRCALCLTAGVAMFTVSMPV